jgi:electron transport complex protein RnfG
VNRLALTLVAVCVAAALVLAVTDRVTRGPIAQQKRQEVLRSLDAVLPPHDNAPDRDTRTVQLDAGAEQTLSLARQGPDWVGTALTVTAHDGYAGDIDVMVGVDRKGAVTGVAILAHAETPGLGDQVTHSNWLAAFRDKALSGTRWAVKKDGGDFDQFTGATISPRAVVGAVHRALEVCARFCR